MRRLLCLLLILIVAFSVVGCGTERTVKTEEGTAKIQDDTIEVTSEDGKSQVVVGEVGEVALPDGYPEDLVPIIADGKVAASTKNEDENNKFSYSVMLFSDKEMKDATSFYKNALKDLEELQVMESPELVTFGGQKNGYNIFVLLGVDNSEDKPRIGINITLTPM
jgi:hypothetical protein